MNIALITEGNIDTISGGYLYDRRLVRYLENRGHNVSLLSMDSARTSAAISPYEMAKELANGDCDIVLEDELAFSKLIDLNRELRGLANVPIISLIHHLSCSALVDAQQKMGCMVEEKRYLESVDGMIFSSHATKEEVNRISGKERVGVVAYPGKDHLVVDRRSDQYRSSFQCLSIIYVGNILPHKGLDVLVRALAIMDERSFHLTVIGGGPDERYLIDVMDQISSNDLGDRIVFLGRTDDRTLAEALGNANVLAGPSYFEGYGISYVEALGHGLPIIATTSGGAREIITDGVEGFLVPPGDPGALAERLGRLIDAPALLTEMSANALRRYTELPDWDESMSLIEGYLLEVLDSMEKVLR